MADDTPWSRIRSSYDIVAAKYEERFVDELDGKPRDRQLLDAFAASVASVGDPVIEVGCGPGQIGAFVRQRGRRVVGVDLSHEMAKLANGRLDAAAAADVRALPIRTAAVGGIIAFYSLIHLHRSELEPVLRELHRLLRPDGRLLFSAHEGTGGVEVGTFLGEKAPVVATYFELDELVAATRAAGFDIILAERRQPYASEGETVRLYVEGRRLSR